MDQRLPDHRQASFDRQLPSEADPAMPVSIRLTAGDFRLILSALYLFHEREIDPQNRRLRIRVGLITMHIHEQISIAARQSRIP